MLQAVYITCHILINNDHYMSYYTFSGYGANVLALSLHQSADPLSTATAQLNKMQGTSVFAVLLVTAASFRLGPPLGIPNCTVDSPWRGLLRYMEGGNKYLMKVPPCVDNVNKTKIIEFYLEYTTSE